MSKLPGRKVTFVLSEELLTQVRSTVEAGLAESTSALFRDAISRRLRELQEVALERTFEDAARDPDFLSDVENTMASFASADAETARRIPRSTPSARQRASTKRGSTV